MAAVGLCDSHHLATLGVVEHVTLLSDNIGALFMQDSYSDLTLVVDGQQFPAHKVVLAARSEYFRALLFGGLRESHLECNTVELKDTPAVGFHHLLKYIYTGKINLSELKEEILLEVLGLANQYGFVELQSAMSEYLQAILNNQNVCLIFDIASMYGLQALCETCCQYMDHNAADILHTEGFLTLSPTALHDLTSRDSFCAPEIDIFRAIQLWAERNSDQQLMQSVMSSVRLPLIKLDDLLNIVRASSLVSADAILDAIKLRTDCTDMELTHRGFLTIDENIATLRHGAQVLRGEMKQALIDGDSTNYDLDRGFTRHPIDDTTSLGIVVRLGQPSIINCIRMLLWDRDMRSYSYYIEGSLDDKDYVRLVDHAHYLCRSWQNLRFSARVVRYIRIVGTHNTVNRVFHLVSFECFYTKKACILEDGIMVPTENVATMDCSACVIEGVSRSRNALINGDTRNYDWDSGYTCHQLGSGAIVVQLAQPYVIGSMRLLLWDCDGRCYSYYIDVSNDQQHWTRVVDKSAEPCRSWQTIVFERQPITFIKIVGTHNTANEVFHCVHFECPAEPAAVTTAQFEQQQRLTMQPTEVDPDRIAGTVMDTDQRSETVAEPRLLSTIAQLPYQRLQGLGSTSRDDDTARVDHGDGYGIGLLGGSRGSPSHGPSSLGRH
jgi:BTB/POZ domain-containing protein 9